MAKFQLNPGGISLAATCACCLSCHRADGFGKASHGWDKKNLNKR